MKNNVQINSQLLIGFAELVRRFYAYYDVQLEEMKIKEVHAKLLHMISDHEGMSQQEIANFNMINRSTTSEVISEMVKENLVERRCDEKDKRISRIYLTEKGKLQAAKIKQYFDEFCLNCYKYFTEEEIESFQNLMMKFNYSKD